MDQNAQKPTIGRIVHYVMPDWMEQAKGQIRPAMIVRVWESAHGVNLQVFVDGSNDGCPSGLHWATSVVNDEDEKKPHTWHWPTRV